MSYFKIEKYAKTEEMTPLMKFYVNVRLGTHLF